MKFLLIAILMIGSLNSTQKRRLFQYWGYTPGKRQWEVHEMCSKYPLVAVRGGNRSGKSMLASMEGASHIQIPDQRVWCVAPTYSLSEKVYNTVRDYGVNKIGWGLTKDHATPPPEFEMANKTHVWGKSWEKISSLEAEGVNKLICDEWGFASQMVWNRLVVRLDQPNSQALFILTPKGKNRYTKQWWAERENDPNSETMSMPTDECEYVSKQFLEMAERELGGKDAPAYKEQIRGEFIAYGLMVYPEWDSKNVQRVDISKQKRVKYYIGVDKGYVHPTAAGFYGITSGDFVFKFAEYHKIYTTNHQNAIAIIKQAGELQKHFKIKFDSLWYDPSAPDLADELKTEAKKAGLLEGGVRVFSADNAVEEGIELVRRLLIDNMYVVDPDCGYTKFNYQNYCYKKDSEKIEKIHDDHCDNDRYVMLSIFSRTRKAYTYKVY